MNIFGQRSAELVVHHVESELGREHTKEERELKIKKKKVLLQHIDEIIREQVSIMLPTAFIKLAIVAQFLGAMIGALSVYLFAPEQMERMAGSVMICLVAVLGWLLLQRGYTQFALGVVVFGTWLAVTGLAFFTGGVHAPMVIAYPLLIMVTGWLIGLRAALSLAGLSLLMTLGFVLADTWGVLPRNLPTPPALQAITQSLVYVISAIQVGFLMRGYRSHLDELVRVGQDLAQRTADLEVSKSGLNRAQAVAKVGSWSYSMADDRMVLSAEACRILALPEGSTGSRTEYLARVHWEDRNGVMQAWKQALDGRGFDHEHRIMSGERTHWVRQKAEFEFASDGSPLRASGITQDVSERKLAEEKINALAYFDQLTGLPNRTLLLDRLRQTMAISDRSNIYNALLFIDLDHFKTLNDTRGHDMGDSLLKQVAQRLQACLREGDTVARLGGDEFVVVLANLSKSKNEAATATETVAEKILGLLQQSYRLGEVDHHSTASVGATLFKGSGISTDELMKQADLTMYRAKAAGRNMVCFFDPAMEVAVNARAALEDDLRRALAAGEFLLHYQAQVVDTGRPIGAEVLLRWQHPQRGMVSPAEFIPLAEETGLIVPMGRWVLATACAQLALWADQPGMDRMTISVNVSAYQFNQPEFVDEVLTVLHTSGANPERLKLELTESLLVDNVQAIIEKMFALKARGVGFSLDDFGTGYSSLAYLKRLPLEQLKIDQSFVRDLLIDPNDATIARTIVALAQSLGLGVIAEGVETLAQRDALASFGCHAYQGYFFSRPVTVEAFEQLALQV